MGSVGLLMMRQTSCKVCDLKDCAVNLISLLNCLASGALLSYGVSAWLVALSGAPSGMLVSVSCCRITTITDLTA